MLETKSTGEPRDGVRRAAIRPSNVTAETAGGLLRRAKIGEPGKVGPPSAGTPSFARVSDGETRAASGLPTAHQETMLQRVFVCRRVLLAGGTAETPLLDEKRIRMAIMNGIPVWAITCLSELEIR